MKSFDTLFIIFFLFFAVSMLNAQDSTRTVNKDSQKQHGLQFIDEDGDGYNDNAPDHDGDGIPNGLDPDWQKDKEGKGKQHRWRFVDLDGDGINDNLQEDAVTDGLNEQIHNQNQKSTSIEGQETKGGAQQKNKKGKKE